MDLIMVFINNLLSITVLILWLMDFLYKEYTTFVKVCLE